MRVRRGTTSSPVISSRRAGRRRGSSTTRGYRLAEADELHDAPRAARHLRHGRLDALARVGRGDGRARAGRQRVRRGGRDRLHAAGRRAAPERAGRRPARAPLAGGRDEPVVLCAQGPAPRARRSSAIATSSASRSSRAPGRSPPSCPGAFGGWLAMLRDHGTLPLRDVLRFAIGYAEDGYPVLPQIAGAIRNVETLFRDEWTTSAEVYLPVPRAGHAARNPRARGDLPARCSTRPRRAARPRRADRGRARRVVPRLRRRGDRRVPGARVDGQLGRAPRRPARRGRPARLAAVVRGAARASTTTASPC